MLSVARAKNLRSMHQRDEEIETEEYYLHFATLLSDH